MAENSPSLGYRDPTIMWRMCRADGLRAHAAIRIDVDGPIVIWFLNDTPVGCRSFADLATALRWTEQMQAQNWATGWRLVD